MKRETLKNLLGESATDDVIDKIMAEHGKGIEAEKAKSQKAVDELATLKDEHKSLTEKVGELEKVSGNAEELKKELEAIKTEQAEKQAQAEAQAKKDGYYAELDKCVPKDMQFMNDWAKDGVYNEAIKAHEADTNQGLEKRFNALIKDEKGNYKEGIFAKSNQPDNIPPMGDTSGSTNNNPFAKDTYNLTEQMRMMKENPSQANAFAREAGVNLEG